MLKSYHDAWQCLSLLFYRDEYSYEMEESENMRYILSRATYCVTIHYTKASKSIVQRGLRWSLLAELFSSVEQICNLCAILVKTKFASDTLFCLRNEFVFVQANKKWLFNQIFSKKWSARLFAPWHLFLSRMKCMGFTYNGEKLFNTLPPQMRESKDPNPFKTMMKNWIWEKITSY